MADRRTRPGQINIEVTTAGSREQVSATTLLVRAVMFQASPDNAGRIYVGDGNVSSAVFGALLTPGNSVSFEAPMSGQGGAEDLDLSQFYVDTNNSGDDVSVTYLYYDS